ncbi:MAG: aspartate-semialdehyde dehydrogenase [Chloroflexota bacterium]
MGYKVALVGATGMVGREFIKTLEERRFPIDEITFYASERSSGRKLLFQGIQHSVREIAPDSFQHVDIAFFATESGISRNLAPVAVRSGAVVCDDSSAFRMDASVPLVIPEVNPEDIRWHKGILSNANCSTIQMVVALSPLHKINPIKRIIVATYQATSGWGQAAMEELNRQAGQVLAGKPADIKIFPHQIAFNVLPEIDSAMDTGDTKEEWKMAAETHKILHDDSIAISASCVRVPVLVGHSEAVWLEFANPMSPEEAREILSHAAGVKVMDDIAAHLYPEPWMAAGKDDVYVGRIRKDTSHANGLVMWIVSDNLRKGSALNTVQIAEEMIKRNWLHPGG